MMSTGIKTAVLMLVLSCLWSSIVSSFRCRPRFLQLSRSFNSLQMAAGRHGQGFKYLPIIKGSPDEPFPRIIHIAGVFPQVTLEEVLAPTSPPAAEPGAWSYDFADPDGPQMGTVALPGSDVITACTDPVVLIAKSTDLGVPTTYELEMIVVVDRGDRHFTPDHFYLFLTPDQSLDIRWMERLEEGYSIVGKIALCGMPFDARVMPKPSGFLEEDDG